MQHTQPCKYLNMNTNNFTVVSTATRKDLPVWKLTQTSLLEYLGNSNINIVVPKNDIEVFKKCTSRSITIHDERDILDIEDFRLSSKNKRINWYYQQFLKLFFFKNLDAKYGLIWDADTCLLDRLPLVSGDKIGFNIGIEKQHSQYFDTIEKMFEVSANYSNSFISQYMAFRIEDLKEMLAYFESKNSYWMLEILNSNFAHDLIFSEYETIAAYLLDKHPGIYIPHSVRWERKGGEAINNLSCLNLCYLKSKFPGCYYVALESYDILRSLTFIDRIIFRYRMGQITLKNILRYVAEKLRNEFSY